MAMAYFMCEKVAEAQYGPTNLLGFRLYQDVRLLREVSGVDLFVLLQSSRRQPGPDIGYLATEFQSDWRGGVYEDPRKEVAKVCEELLPKETNEHIDPLDIAHDISPVRLYGIFGLPELIRQIKQHNSKHAFAAYLNVTITVRQKDDYTDYIRHSYEQFTTKEAKLEHVKGTFDAMKRTAGDKDYEILKQIAAALEE